MAARLGGGGSGGPNSSATAPSIASRPFVEVSSFFFFRENIEPSLLQPLRRGERRRLASENARLRCVEGINGGNDIRGGELVLEREGRGKKDGGKRGVESGFKYTRTDLPSPRSMDLILEFDCRCKGCLGFHHCMILHSMASS